MLDRLHERFYGPATADSSSSSSSSSSTPDVKAILRDMKTSVLQGVVVAFSGVIPQRAVPEQYAAGRQGARVGRREWRAP